MVFHYDLQARRRRGHKSKPSSAPSKLPIDTADFVNFERTDIYDATMKDDQKDDHITKYKIPVQEKAARKLILTDRVEIINRSLPNCQRSRSQIWDHPPAILVYHQLPHNRAQQVSDPLVHHLTGKIFPKPVVLFPSISSYLQAGLHALLPFYLFPNFLLSNSLLITGRRTGSTFFTQKSYPRLGSATTTR